MRTRRFTKPGIRDVATAAGVSVTTVSSFVGGRKYACSEETAVRIRKAIEDLNYTPSAATRGMRQRETRTIGVIMQDPVEVFNDPASSWAQWAWSGILYEADAHDYGILHYPHSVRHSEVHAPLLDGRVDGLLFSPSLSDNRPAATARAGMPTLVIDRFQTVPAGCGAVSSDERAVIDLALDHLWTLGHRRIAHIAGPLVPDDAQHDAAEPPSDVATWRRKLYISWLSTRSAFDPRLLFGAGRWQLSEDASLEVIMNWMALENPPTAVLCADDLIALSILAAAKAMGIRVPEDFSVVGIDNNPLAATSTPGLTTVQTPVEMIGREGMRSLIRIMDGADPESVRIWLPPTGLVVRGSTGPVPIPRVIAKKALCR